MVGRGKGTRPEYKLTKQVIFTYSNVLRVTSKLKYKKTVDTRKVKLLKTMSWIFQMTGFTLVPVAQLLRPYGQLIISRWKRSGKTNTKKLRKKTSLTDRAW